jgi:hypothetical protein
VLLRALVFFVHTAPGSPQRFGLLFPLRKPLRAVSELARLRGRRRREVSAPLRTLVCPCVVLRKLAQPCVPLRDLARPCAAGGGASGPMLLGLPVGLKLSEARTLRAKT